MPPESPPAALRPAPAPAARRTRWRRRVLALALSLAACFALVEATARARLGAPLPERLPILRVRANRWRGWEMMPGETHYTYMHPVQVNALGLRGAELGAKAAGERRVLCLGDSLIYGQGVSDADTVPAWLEAALARAGSGWRAVNGGLRAYGTEQELGLLEDLGPEIAPDVVVLFWFWNDVVERSVADTYARLADAGPVAFDASAPLEGWTLVRWRALQLARRSAAVMFAWDQWRARRSSFLSQDVQDAGIERLGAHLGRLRRLCERTGAQPMVAVIPEAPSLVHPHPARDLSLRALEQARAQGIPVVDLHAALEELARSGDVPLTIPFDGHYTGAANRAMAEAVARAIESLP